ASIICSLTEPALFLWRSQQTWIARSRPNCGQSTSSSKAA
ncbi:hypothetical protein ACLKA7_005226, partial [Drosophila subpalustris]